MNLRDIYYFQTLAETRHMGRAAELLFITQPALSKAIQRLEESIGASLFTRTTRRIELTELGTLLLERSFELRHLMEETTREVQGFATGYSGNIRLGCAPTMVKFYLPGIISRLLKDSPDVTIQLETGISGPLIEALKDRQLDFVLTHVTKQMAGFEVTPLVRDEMVVVARPDHPLFDRTPQVSDLAHYNWILPSASGSLPWLDALMAKHGCPAPKAQVEATSILYLPRLIAGTNLLSLMSRSNLSEEENHSIIREVPIAEARLERFFGIIVRKDGFLSPAAQKLLAMLRADSTLDGDLLTDTRWEAPGH